MAQTNIPLRSEADPRTCWAVEDAYPSDEAWSQALDACKSYPAELAAYAGRLGESGQTLLEYLTRMEAINFEANRLYVYAYIRQDEDTTNAAHQAMHGRCFNFLIELSSASSFEGPELVAIDDETLDRFYQEAPGLEKFRRYLTKARLSRAHILSPAEESLLAAVGDVGQAPSTIFNTFNNADLKFPQVTDSQGEAHALTKGSYISLMESQDRKLRENTFRSFYSVYQSYENTLAAAYNAEVRKNLFYAKARKYESALEGALQPVEVPVSVYHNLLAAVHANLDKMHRYMALRKRVMGLDELHMYDIYANMLPGADQVIPFSQAKEEVLAATKVLGEEYSRVLASAFEQRWVDVYENQGKCSGAYSYNCPGVHPFVLMSYKDNLNTEFTLAHEMGHAMHSYLSEKYQPAINSDYVLFVAEVASICNESLLMQYLLGRTEDKQKRAVLINYFLEQFRTTLYRQTMFADFELQAHELAASGETLTAEALNKLYYRLNQQYYGDNVVIDEAIAVEWARIPHFYTNFYVYQYSTGFAAAMALSARILKEGEPAVKDYLKFLSGGCSTDPISLLKIAGVDVSTSKPVNDALTLFGELIEELEGLLAD